MAQVLTDFHNLADSADEDEVYVAVGDDDDDNVSLLKWAMQYFAHHKFYIIYVHHTSEIISPSQEEWAIDAAILSSKLDYLDAYVHMCNKFGIQAEQVYSANMESIEEGILALVSQFNIQKLVMGAASYQNNDTKICEPKSRKATYVNSNAPPFCQIWFIFRGELVCTREMPSSLSTQEMSSSLSMQSPQSAMNFEDVYRANALEKLYTEELRKRKELEVELEMLKSRHEQTLSASAAQKLIIAGYEQNIKELENKVSSHVELVRIREEERDKAVKRSLELTETVENLSSEAEPPSYFVCPILQEVMEDPRVATDGYTYEAEALRQWLGRGNETSPMTNEQLESTHLVPNRTLRSAIQEWLQHFQRH